MTNNTSTCLSSILTLSSSVWVYCLFRSLDFWALFLFFSLILSLFLNFRVWLSFTKFSIQFGCNFSWSPIIAFIWVLMFSTINYWIWAIFGSYIKYCAKIILKSKNQTCLIHKNVSIILLIHEWNKIIFWKHWDEIQSWNGKYTLLEDSHKYIEG